MSSYKSLTLFCIIVSVLSVLSPVYATKTCDFPAIFNFGDGNSDTGGFSVTFSGTPQFYGQTYFNGTTGRSSDGRLIIDFIASSLGKPFLNAYLDSLGTSFSQGANFAQLLATIGVPQLVLPKDSPPFGFSPVYLGVQFSEFVQFVQRSQKVRNQGGVFASFMPKTDSFAKGLYTFDIGQNDLSQGLFTGLSVDQIKQNLPALIDSFTAVLKNLYNLVGARTFWIHNTGPLGCYPYILTILPTTDVDSVGCSKAVNGLAQAFNTILKKAVDQLRVDLPLAAITYVDIYSAYYSLYVEPEVYGMSFIHLLQFNFNISEFRSVAKFCKISVFLMITRGPGLGLSKNSLCIIGVGIQLTFHPIQTLVSSGDVLNVKLQLYKVKHIRRKRSGFELPLEACCGLGGAYNFGAATCGATAVVNGTEVTAGPCEDPSKRINWDGFTYTEAANKIIFGKLATGLYSDPLNSPKTACQKVSLIPVHDDM